MFQLEQWVQVDGRFDESWRTYSRMLVSYSSMHQNKKLCGATMQRRFLNNHLMITCPRRSHQCPHCKLQGEYHTIMGPEHLDRCPDLKITCTICDKNVKRRMMEEHKRVCLVEPVPCPYQNVGCSARPRRQDIPQHNLEAMGNHLQLAVSFIA